ncbi:MAG: hypothetical protein ACXW18_11030 [Pyrinomonadaceae bacterium]
MTPTSQIGSDYLPPSRVSILARLVPVFSLCIPMLGAALCAVLLMRVLEAMRNAESAGIGAVAGGMSEANLAMTVALYVGAFVGFIGIVVMAVRAFTSTTTGSPSALFFVIAGVLCLLPLVFLWSAQTIFLDGIRGGNISLVASSLLLFLKLTIVSAAVVALILLIVSFVPMPSLLRAKRKWAPLIVLLIIQFAMIGTAVVFQMRTAWLHGASIMERL